MPARQAQVNYNDAGLNECGFRIVDCGLRESQKTGGEILDSSIRNLESSITLHKCSLKKIDSNV